LKEDADSTEQPTERPPAAGRESDAARAVVRRRQRPIQGRAVLAAVANGRGRWGEGEEDVDRRSGERAAKGTTRRTGAGGSRVRRADSAAGGR